MARSREAVEQIARAHLPSDIATKWIGLLRPAARLRGARPGTDPVVGQLGGLPALPSGIEWPVWIGHGPLSFIASFDCRAVAEIDLDIALPREGRLLFFYFDGQLDDGTALVIYSDPPSLEGARVIYVPSEEGLMSRVCPQGLVPYPRIDVTAEVTTTYPRAEDPLLMEAFGRPGETFHEFLRHPVNNDAFVESLGELELSPSHQVGGYPDPIQGPVEHEVAQAVLSGVPWASPALSKEARRWRLLLQIDTDAHAKMMWGDAGVLYWLIRPSDLLEKRFDQAAFTWQCA